MMNHEFYMQHALLLAKKAQSENEVPVGALIVYNNEIIAEGWNQPIKSHDPGAHAEIITLRNAAQTLQNYRLNNTTLYVTLEPCVMCIGAIIHARVARLVFGAYDLKTGAVHSAFPLLDDPRHNHRVQWSGGVYAEQCSDLLKQFFQNKR